MSDELVVERAGAVVTVRLNRPEARNALTPSLMAALGAAMVQAERDPAVRAVVLTGTGDRAFCAGMDLRSFASGADMALADDDSTQGFRRLLRGEVTVPVVGAANGSALAGGFELLLGCDLVVAAEGAQLGLPEVKRGLFPGGGGTTLGTRVPLAVALELLLTGDSIDAGRARELGLVNAVVAPDRVVTAAVELAERVAANGPLGVAAAKELARLAVTDAAAAERRAAEWQPIVFGSEDAKEGARAFVARRPPVWRGR